jgi:hypothetical protein
MSQADEESERFDILIDEISEGIRNLSSSPKKVLKTLFKQLKESTRSDSHPQITYATLLFRQYANIANDLKQQLREYTLANESIIAMETSDELQNSYAALAGWSAMNNKLFWYRASTAILVFISFVLMSNVPNIRLASLRAWEIFSVSVQLSVRCGISE